MVNPTEEGHLAASGGFGPAVVPDLSAYSEREVYHRADRHAGRL